MQASLFSPALDFKEEALKHLSRFELQEAREDLARARDFDPYLADLDLLSSLCEFTQTAGAHTRMSAAKAEQLWQLAEQAGRAGKIAIAANKLLRELIARRLLAGEFTPAGFCLRAEGYLHRGVCHLALGHWDEAHRELLQLVTTHHEQALPIHWAYFADAAFALKRWAEANLGYLCALMTDSMSVDESTLAHSKLRDILRRLRLREKVESLARALWPFEAWREGELEIAPGKNFLFLKLQQRRSLLGSELMLERGQRLRQFCLCLYVDQANLHDQINFDARAEMKALEPELFAAYLGEVARRGGSNTRLA